MLARICISNFLGCPRLSGLRRMSGHTTLKCCRPTSSVIGLSLHLLTLFLEEQCWSSWQVLGTSGCTDTTSAWVTGPSIWFSFVLTSWDLYTCTHVQMWSHARTHRLRKGEESSFCFTPPFSGGRCEVTFSLSGASSRCWGDAPQAAHKHSSWPVHLPPVWHIHRSDRVLSKALYFVYKSFLSKQQVTWVMWQWVNVTHCC